MLKFIERHFGLMIFSGIILGLFIGKLFDVSEFVPLMRQIIIVELFLMLFLAVLKTNLLEFSKSFEKLGTISLLTFSKLILVPVIVFFISFLFPEEYRVGLVLLAATPAAVASPGLLLLLRGNVGIGLVLAILTNLLAPFTIPLVLLYTVGADVQMDVLSMFTLLSVMSFGPFMLAYPLEKWRPKFVKKVNKYSSALITLIVFSFMVFAVAPYAGVILENVSDSLMAFLVVLILSILLHLFGFFFFDKGTKKIMVPAIIIFAYFNAGLSIILAIEYFDATTVLLTVFYEFVWAIGLIPLQMIFAKKT